MKRMIDAGGRKCAPGTSICGWGIKSWNYGRLIQGVIRQRSPGTSRSQMVENLTFVTRMRLSGKRYTLLKGVDALYKARFRSLSQMINILRMS